MNDDPKKSSSAGRHNRADNSISKVLSHIRANGHHARNLVSQFVCRFVALASFALALPFFISRQGAASYGVIALLFTAYSFVSLLDFGVSYSISLRYGRAIARTNHRAPRILGGALPLSVAFAAVAAAVIDLAAKPISFALYGVGSYSHAIEVFGGSVGLLIISATPSAAVLVHYRVDWVNYSKLIVDLSKAAALVIASLSDSPIVVAMWVLLFGTGLKCLVDFVQVIFLAGTDWMRALRARWLDTRTNLALGLPMSVASTLNVGLTSGDRVIVSRLFGAQALASYSLAADLCSKAYFVVWAITGTVYPLVIRSAAARRDVSTYLKVALLSVVGVAVVVYIPLAILARPLIGWWLGPAMAASAGTVTSIWAAVAVIYLAMTVLYNQLQAEGRPWILFLSNAAGLALMAGGMAFFAKGSGIEGVALIMGLTFLMLALVLWVARRRAGPTRVKSVGVAIEVPS